MVFLPLSLKKVFFGLGDKNSQLSKNDSQSVDRYGKRFGKNVSTRRCKDVVAKHCSITVRKNEKRENMLEQKMQNVQNADRMSPLSGDMQKDFKWFHCYILHGIYTIIRGWIGCVARLQIRSEVTHVLEMGESCDVSMKVADSHYLKGLSHCNLQLQSMMVSTIFLVHNFLHLMEAL